MHIDFVACQAREYVGAFTKKMDLARNTKPLRFALELAQIRTTAHNCERWFVP